MVDLSMASRVSHNQIIYRATPCRSIALEKQSRISTTQVWVSMALFFVGKAASKPTIRSQMRTMVLEYESLHLIQNWAIFVFFLNV